jgi:hypothetical protein
MFDSICEYERPGCPFQEWFASPHVDGPKGNWNADIVEARPSDLSKILFGLRFESKKLYKYDKIRAYDKGFVVVFQLAEAATSRVTGHGNAESPLVDCGWVFLVYSRGYELWKEE